MNDYTEFDGHTLSRAAVCPFCGEGTDPEPIKTTLKGISTYAFNCDCWLYANESSEVTNCWKCHTEIYRWIAPSDAPYGNFCPTCNRTLRSHPRLGSGRVHDLKVWKKKGKVFIKRDIPIVPFPIVEIRPRLIQAV